MKRIHNYLPLGILLTLIIVVAACSGSPSTLGTSEPLTASEPLVFSTATTFMAPPTEVPVPVEPSVELPHPIPAAGKGNLVGQVRWNVSGAANIDMKICTEFSWFGGCKGTIYSASTGADGIYIFKDIDPGEYALTVRVFETDSWLYMTTGLMSERMYTVRANETTEVGVSDIYKVDLKSTQPSEKANVNEARPVLKWDAYEDAILYKVWLNPEKGDSVAIYEETATNEYTPAEDLFNCEYTWKVEAYNTNGVKISEMDDYRHFTVSGAQYKCVIEVIKPANNASVPSSGIELEWESHPLADYYKLFLWPENDSNTHILDFLEVRGTTYTVTDTLSPGKYVLSVYVYDANNRQIAGSDISYLIVK